MFILEETYSENCFRRFARFEDFSLLILVFKVVSMCCFVYLFTFIDPLDEHVLLLEECLALKIYSQVALQKAEESVQEAKW